MRTTPALLGSDPARPLNLSGSVFAGYDSNLNRREAEPRQGAGASHTGGLLSLNYDTRSQDFAFYTQAVSEFRHYRSSQTINAPMGFVSAGLSKGLGRRWRLNMGLQGAYYPQFQFSMLPATSDIPTEQPLPTLDYGLNSFDVMSYQGYAGVTYSLSNRSTVNAGYGNGRFNYIGRGYRLKTQSVQGGYSYNLTRYARLQLGYAEEEGRYVVNAAAVPQVRRRRQIDVGVNYSRPLSLSRRTTIAFSTGSTAADDGVRTYYALTGSARLNHTLSRYWITGIAYSRRLGMVGGFYEPIFSDSIFANLNGLLSRRVSLGTSAGFALGHVGVASLGNNNYDSFQANARIEAPITRGRMSVFGTYFYYRHLFDQAIALPAGLVPRYGRHGVRAGLTVGIL